MPLRISQIKPYTAYLSKELSSRRIGKLCQYSEDAYVFALSHGGKLVFVLSGGDPYVYISSSFPEGNSFSSSFSMALRKSLSNAFIEKVEAIEGDRILKFTLSAINDVFKSVQFSLIVELIPNRPNLILVNEEGKIEAAHKTNALTDAHPIFRGVTYLPPEKKFFLEEGCQNFDIQSYVSACAKKEEILIATRKKQRFAGLLKFLKTKDKALDRKIQLIEKDQEEAKKHLNDGKYGDFIYMNYSSLPKKANGLVYEGETIPLDPRKNLALNAEAFYKRAKKAKATLALEEENKAKAEREREQVKNLLSVIVNADESFLLLAEKEYGLNKIESKGISSTALSDSALHPYEIQKDGSTYLFGRNAKQNDFLSFAYATNKSFLWFHVKDDHGAHVILKKADPSNEEIAFACEIALLASKKEEGEVMYCPRKNVKRGNVPGQAVVKEYKSATFRRIGQEAKEAFASAKKAK